LRYSTGENQLKAPKKQMEQVAILEIKVKSQSLDAALEQARDSVRRLNAEFRKTKEGTDDYKRLSGELANAKNAVKDLTAQQKTLNKEFAALKVPKDSLAGMRLEYSRLSQQIANLSAEERKSSFGKSLISSAKSVKGEIDGIEQSIGRFTGNVGNYKSAFGSVFGLLRGGAVGLLGGLTAGSIANTTKEFERLITVLTQNFNGDRVKALEVFGQIRQFAAETPFQVDELTQAFIRFQSIGITPTNDVLRDLGDFAAAQGRSIQQVVEAVVDVGVGQTRRLEELGVKSQVANGKVVASFKDVSVTVPQTNAGILQLIQTLGKAQGVAGGMAAQAKTLGGALSNAGDSIDRLSFAFGGKFSGTLTEIVTGFAELTNSIAEYLEQPISETIQDEATRFNSLAGAVLNAGENTELRTRLINQMKAEYPDFLKGISAEKASFDDLTKSIAAANFEFQKRIALSVAEEKLAEVAKKIEKAQRAQVETAIELSNVQSRATERENRENPTGQTIPGLTRGFRAVVTNENDARNIENATNQLQKQGDEVKVLQSEYKELNTTLDNAFRLISGGEGMDEAKARMEGGGVKSAASETVKATKEEAKAAKGSIKELQDQINNLTQQLESAPPDQIERILGDLVKKEKELERLENRVKQLRKAPNARFVPGASSDTAPPLTIGDGELAADGVSGDAQRMLNAVADTLSLEVRTILRPPDDKEVAELQRVLEDVRIKNANAEWDFNREQDEKDKEARKERIMQGVQAGADILSGVNSQMSDIRREEINDELDAQIAALDKKTQAEIEAAGTNQAAIDQIKAQSEKKREELEKQAAEKRKQVAIKEALIAGALAVIKALPNPIAAGAAAAATLVQVALMRKQKFEKGGKVALISGPSHAARGVQGYFSDGTRIEVEGDEELHVLKRNNTSAKQRLSMENIRRGGVPLFERGGYVPLNNIPLSRSYGPSSQTNVTVRLSDADIQKLAVTLAAETAGQTSVAVEGAVINGMQQGTRLNERISDAQKLRRV